MEKSFKEALKHRRTYYAITNQSPISDKEIEEIIDFAVTHVPSAFNSQSTRVVLLLGDNHRKLWQIVKNTLWKIVTPEAFKNTEAKIDHSFASGYGTVLFFEDQNVVQDLQNRFISYKDNFPGWAMQTSAMHQLAVWTMLEDAGFGGLRQVGGQLPALLLQSLASCLAQFLRLPGSLLHFFLGLRFSLFRDIFRLLLSLGAGVGHNALGLLQAFASAAVQIFLGLGQFLFGLALLLKAVVDALLSLLPEADDRFEKQLVEQEHKYKEAQDSEQQLRNIDGQHVRFSFQSRTAVKSWR